ncbi:polyketide synthase [Spirochaeta isovalerica]|uniref:Polyketide biosynthesis enoyl-CoA hydratase PksI n=1 Tax=Spirochaeta isovalerica TaxID=150 RepID=A0A841R9V1_9SPIO|nr:polyketide biosynthesis enoyl-CoA hydratase PksI [Spirochaeta isovalerica]
MADNMQLHVDENNIAHLKMNDVENKNIFSNDFIRGFLETMDELEANYKPHCLILSGLDSVFCAGAEKDTLIDLSNGKIDVKDLLMSERLVNTEYPVIAAMEGHAMGGGLVLALCSDIVIAARESRYGAVFMNMGFTPGMGTTTLLQGLMGDFIANEMMFTGKRFKGSELAQKGTNINYIVPKKDVLAKALDIALQISEKNVKSVNLLKYTLSAKKKKLLVDARLQEDMMHKLSFAYPETKERINSFYAD